MICWFFLSLAHFLFNEWVKLFPDQGSYRKPNSKFPDFSPILPDPFRNSQTINHELSLKYQLYLCPYFPMCFLKNTHQIKHTTETMTNNGYEELCFLKMIFSVPFENVGTHQTHNQIWQKVHVGALPAIFRGSWYIHERSAQDNFWLKHCSNVTLPTWNILAVNHMQNITRKNETKYINTSWPDAACMCHLKTHIIS